MAWRSCINAGLLWRRRTLRRSLQAWCVIAKQRRVQDPEQWRRARLQRQALLAWRAHHQQQAVWRAAETHHNHRTLPASLLQLPLPRPDPAWVADTMWRVVWRLKGLAVRRRRLQNAEAAYHTGARSARDAQDPTHLTMNSSPIATALKRRVFGALLASHSYGRQLKAGAALFRKST